MMIDDFYSWWYMMMMMMMMMMIDVDIWYNNDREWLFWRLWCDYYDKLLCRRLRKAMMIMIDDSDRWW